MTAWRARGVELLLLAAERQLTEDERAELIRLCNRARGWSK